MPASLFDDEDEPPVPAPIPAPAVPLPNGPTLPMRECSGCRWVTELTTDTEICTRCQRPRFAAIDRAVVAQYQANGRIKFCEACKVWHER